MPRFVILHHVLPAEDPRDSHWDLMLEFDDVLRTWALAQRPDSILEADGLKHCILAEQLPDHRLAYLEYEGPVSENRGTVTRWDTGEYELWEDTSKQIGFTLHGENVSGDWALLLATDYWALQRAKESGATYWDLGRL